MKIIIVLLSCMSCFAMAQQASGQTQNKTDQSKDVATSYKPIWVPPSIRPVQKSSSRLAQPSARITANEQKQNTSKARLENIVFKSTDGGLTWHDISEGLPNDLEKLGFFSNNGGLYLRGGDGIYHSKPNSTGPFWSKEICPDRYSNIAYGKSGIFAYNYEGQFYKE